MYLNTSKSPQKLFITVQTGRQSQISLSLTQIPRYHHCDNVVGIIIGTWIWRQWHFCFNLQSPTCTLIYFTQYVIKTFLVDVFLWISKRVHLLVLVRLNSSEVCVCVLHWAVAAGKWVFGCCQTVKQQQQPTTAENMQPVWDLIWEQMKSRWDCSW